MSGRTKQKKDDGSGNLMPGRWVRLPEWADEEIIKRVEAETALGYDSSRSSVIRRLILAALRVESAPQS